MLHAKNIHKAFGGVKALQGVTLTIEPKRITALIGPNGAGRTVLFRALLGLLPHEGTVAWKGGTTIGYVPQKFAVEKDAPCTVKEFFLLKADRFWFPRRSFITHLAHELNLVGLEKNILQKKHILIALSHAKMIGNREMLEQTNRLPRATDATLGAYMRW